MREFTVEVQRTATVTVTVSAENEIEALKIVDRADYPLPEFELLGDWNYVVRDEDENELYDGDGSDLDDVREQR